MIVQLPPKEKAGSCIVQGAYLYCEPCNMAVVHPCLQLWNNEQSHGQMRDGQPQKFRGRKCLDWDHNGEHSISKIYGDTIFGKTWILNG
jgi:hypothetical protein